MSTSPINMAKNAQGYVPANHRQRCGNCQHVYPLGHELRCRKGAIWVTHYAVCTKWQQVVTAK